MSRFAKKTESDFLAIIGDLAGSRRLPDRSVIQQRLEGALVRLNGSLPAGALASRFVITVGDEFQGMLRQPDAALTALLHLEEAEPAIRIRYGIGWGSLATPLRRDAIGMDGPCFHHARGALMASKQHDRWAAVRGFGPVEDRVLDSMFAMLAALRTAWTEKQARTVALARAADTQKSVAEALAVSPSVVSEALKAAHWEAVREGEEGLRAALARFAAQGEAA